MTECLPARCRRITRACAIAPAKWLEQDVIPLLVAIQPRLVAKKRRAPIRPCAEEQSKIVDCYCVSKKCKRDPPRMTHLCGLWSVSTRSADTVIQALFIGRLGRKSQHFFSRSRFFLPGAFHRIRRIRRIDRIQAIRSIYGIHLPAADSSHCRRVCHKCDETPPGPENRCPQAFTPERFTPSTVR